jgi:hypothetical protein
MKNIINNISKTLILVTIITIGLNTNCQARDIEYQGSEVTISVTPGEPTQVQFPAEIQGGFKKNLSSLHLDRKDSDLIVFAAEGLSSDGEAIIVRLKDGRSYSLRMKLSDSLNPRDDVVKMIDRSVGYAEEETAPYQEKNFGYASSSTVSGLMRELVLFAEFGKKKIPGYKVSDRYKGETVLNDGALKATIDVMITGPNLWGYVLDTENQLDQTVKLNPASFRMDGTRAISAKYWELAPQPINAEQQVSARHKTKLYVITRAKKFQ